MSGTVLTLQIADTDLDQIKLATTLAISRETTYISVGADAFADNAGKLYDR